MNVSKPQILVVDDDIRNHEPLNALLTSAGYDVTCVVGGFQALLQLKRSLPEVVISDLNMPQMSGFEFLSVVRRRFPGVSVIAMSGAYNSGSVPNGVISDGFYAKGSHNPEELLALLKELIATHNTRHLEHIAETAPVWIPRNGKDSSGVPFVVLTCTECLRSFPLSVPEMSDQIRETACLFCQNVVRYIVDFSRSVTSPARSGI